MSNNIVLIIDTHEQHKTIVAVDANGIRTEKNVESAVHTSQMVLPLIDDLLGMSRISLSEITGIRVHTGPGSFTGIRVGIAVANALASVLGIQVNGKKSLAQANY